MQKCHFKSFHRNLPEGDITINCIVRSFKIVWKLYLITCTNLKVKKHFLLDPDSILLLSKYIVDREKQAFFTISENRCISQERNAALDSESESSLAQFKIQQSTRYLSLSIVCRCFWMMACQNIFFYLRYEVKYEYDNNYNLSLVIAH